MITVMSGFKSEVKFRLPAPRPADVTLRRRTVPRHRSTRMPVQACKKGEKDCLYKPVKMPVQACQTGSAAAENLRILFGHGIRKGGFPLTAKQSDCRACGRCARPAHANDQAPLPSPPSESFRVGSGLPSGSESRASRCVAHNRRKIAVHCRVHYGVRPPRVAVYCQTPRRAAVPHHDASDSGRDPAGGPTRNDRPSETVPPPGPPIPAADAPPGRGV